MFNRSSFSRPAWQVSVLVFILCAGLLRPAFAQRTYDSGSTGADGAFAPTANVEVQLREPPNHVFNFTTVNIPAGVTVKFKRNVANTPVFILASGDVTIDGTIDVSGGNEGPVGTGGDPSIGGDPGKGGPGGFDGGWGGLAGGGVAGRGQGPGGGRPEEGGKFGGIPGAFPPRPPVYGTPELQPLIGGSGGGGRSNSSPIFRGPGGGGGGGAILIACSGTLTVTVRGAILAKGGGTYVGGSGGAIRLAATRINIPYDGDGNRRINAGTPILTNLIPGDKGRIRVEFLYVTAYSEEFEPNPSLSFSPAPPFLSTPPRLAITSIAGQPVPANPTGSFDTPDVTLPQDQANPVTVALAASGVPPGVVPKVRVIPQRGDHSEVNATALAGNEAASAATAQVNISAGNSLIETEVTFTETLLAWLPLDTIDGEKVRKARLVAALGGHSQIIYTTTSGRAVRDDQIRSITNRKGSTKKK